MRSKKKGQLTLAELTEEVRRSDHAAFAELYRRLSRPLVSYARGFTGDVASAHDVLQDVFEKLWNIRGRLADDSSIQSLMYTMIRNRALNVRRKSARIVGLESNGVTDNNIRQPIEELQSEELESQIEKWVLEMPDRRSEAFILSRYHGLSHKEIAEIMEISERTAQTHIVHALRELREKLSTYNDEAEHKRQDTSA